MPFIKYPLPAQIFNFGKEKRLQGYRVKHSLKTTSRFLFQACLEGEGELFRNGKRFSIEKNSALFLKIPTSAVYGTASKWSFVFVSVNGSWATEVCEVILKKYGNVLKLSKESRSIRVALEIAQLNNGLLITSPRESASYAFRFLIALMDDLEGTITGVYPPSVEKAVSYIKLHFSKAIKVSELSGQSGLTREHFSRLFTQHTGVGPAEYLLNVRLGEAIKYLSQNDLSVLEIAQKVGFSQRAVFTRAFKKQVGLSPEKWRENPM